MNTSNYKKVLAEIEETWQNYFPDNPFDFFFLDEFYNQQYEQEKQYSKMLIAFSGLSVLIACLGLYGMVSYHVLLKRKEIGIRKVLGADISQIVMILSKEFLIQVAIANIISWPLVFLVMDGWLDNFTSRVDIGISIFIIAAVIVLLIAVVAVGYKTISTAKTNPVKALRYE